jgi:FAD/FMN-containing dehydrogenase
MATQGVLGAATLKEFEDGLHGELIRPGDGAYEEARLIWNGAHDARPAVIVRCADSSDVRHAIGFARSEGLDVAVRGGGHSIPGFSTCDDGIVIDLSPMKGIRVDVSGRTATAEGGVTWGEFDAATQQHGLATTGGLVSSTGVAGFTLGGGVGWLMRKCGLACDNLRSAEVLTADGQILTASATENPDLPLGPARRRRQFRRRHLLRVRSASGRADRGGRPGLLPGRPRQGGDALLPGAHT